MARGGGLERSLAGDQSLRRAHELGDGLYAGATRRLCRGEPLVGFVQQRVARRADLVERREELSLPVALLVEGVLLEAAGGASFGAPRAITDPVGEINTRQ